MTTIACDTCQHWDVDMIRQQRQTKSLCQCVHSADYRRYVNAYHTCHWHSAIKWPEPQATAGDTHA